MGHLEPVYKSVISLGTSLTCPVATVQPCLQSSEESIKKEFICANVN